MVNRRKSRRQVNINARSEKNAGPKPQAGAGTNSSQSEESAKQADHASVLGGMRGGFRVNIEGVDPDKPDNASNEQTREVASTNVPTFNIAFGDKSIVCQRHGSSEQQAAKPTSLIFTHGAGGGIANPATQDFVSGFSSVAPTVVAFQGTMNLQNRVKTFATVLDHLDGESNALPKRKEAYPALGGRSMGARAAVIAANDRADDEIRPKALVLVSYPLLGGKEGDQVRDKILSEVAEDVDVLFVSGSKDKMCPLDRLQDIRRRMKATSWCVVVESADHGMSMTGSAKRSVSDVRRTSGEVAAAWLKERHRERRECHISWVEEDAEVAVSDWRAEEEDEHVTAAVSGSKERSDELAPNKRKSKTSEARDSPSKRLKRS